jgi:succinate dehydrogenase / fumarate reductase cytochrome b subunit
MVKIIRPLAPHIQIYKIQITSLLSILHRGTGIVLYGGVFLWSIWFFMLVSGPENYQKFQDLLCHPVGILFLLVLSFSFFYHLCNGIRHLCWDLGYGYEMVAVRRTGWIVVIASFILTGTAWIIGLSDRGMWP